MRINYYVFPEDATEQERLENGCPVFLKDGGCVFVKSIPDDKRHLVDEVGHSLNGITVTTAKRLLKQYGGYGFTCHYDRDGGLFETTDITLSGNNSKFQYNRHL